jgi:hypothetical protein
VEDFSSFFIEHPDEPFPFEGKLVWQDLSLEVTDGLILNIDVISYKWRPIQSITYVSKNCQMELAHESCDYMHIHASSKPKFYRIDFNKVKPDARIHIFNSWELRKGEIEFGIGNAGMLIEEVSIDGKPGYRCSCSDSWRRTDFKSLVFQVQVAKGNARRLLNG